MTPNERKKYMGHWSTTDLALKDAYRLIFHLWQGCPNRACSTCDYIATRLKVIGYKDKDQSSEG